MFLLWLLTFFFSIFYLHLYVYIKVQVCKISAINSFLKRMTIGNGAPFPPDFYADPNENLGRMCVLAYS